MGRKRDDDFWQGTDRRDYEEPPEDYYLDEPDDGYWDDEGPDSSIPDETLSVIHQYIEGTYTIFPERKKEAEITGNARQLSLFDFMDAGTGEPEAHENTEPAGKTEKEETEVRYPEAEPEAEETAHSEPELPQEKPDSAHYEEIDGQVSEAVEVSGTAFDEYSPEQMDVIYAAAEAGVELAPLLHPEFPPEQMQLIADVLEGMAAENKVSFDKEINPLTSHVMNPEEINAARRERNLPLEPVDAAENDTPENQIENQGEENKPVAAHSPQRKPSQRENQDKANRVNFRITDDDLGAGGPKQKFRANMEAVHLLHELESEGRMATPQEQEVLSRYVGWGGLAQAFEENNGAWSEEHAELYAELSPEEYRAARASTLNAFYTSPTVIKAMYEALGNMGLKSGNVLDKTTPRLIQFHALKNAVNPPLLGGFSIFGTVAA